MNNLRLLTGLMSVVLLSGGVCAYSETVISLEEIFDIADANSAQLRPSISSVSEADKEISVASSARLPDIDASLSFSFLGDGFTTDRKLGDYQKASIPHFGNGLSINITQPLYTGGSVTSAIELARLKSTAARYTLDFQRDNLRFRLTGLYLDIYKYCNLRRVLESNIAAARKLLEDMKARYEQGMVLKNDITRYELLVSNLDLQLIRINNTIEILNSDLVITAGLPENMVVVPDSTILARSLPKEGVDWWQKEADENSSVLSIARSEVEISRKAESLVRSERLPKVGVQAGWSIDGPILVEVPPINRNLSYWYVGVGVNFNLSSLYKSNKSISRSRVATQKALEQLNATRDELTQAVNADHIRYLEAYEELKTRQKSVELAERNYLTTSTRFSADMALITEMLDAANSRLDAEQQLVNARINIIYYYYKLLFTTGKI